MDLDLQNPKLWIGGGAVAGLLIVGVAWLLAIGPMRANTDQLRGQTQDALTQNSSLLAQNASLEQDAKSLPAYRLKLAKAIEALPPDTNLSEFTQTLSALAQQTGVTLSSIAVGGVTAPTTAPTAATSPSTNSSSTTSTASSAPAAAASSAAPSQLIASITVQVNGSTGNDLNFLEAVRNSPRSALVTSTQLTKGGEAGRTLLTAQLDVFSAPVSAAQRTALRHLLVPGK